MPRKPAENPFAKPNEKLAKVCKRTILEIDGREVRKLSSAELRDKSVDFVIALDAKGKRRFYAPVGAA